MIYKKYIYIIVIVIGPGKTVDKPAGTGKNRFRRLCKNCGKTASFQAVPVDIPYPGRKFLLFRRAGKRKIRTPSKNLPPESHFPGKFSGHFSTESTKTFHRGKTPVDFCGPFIFRQARPGSGQSNPQRKGWSAPPRRSSAASRAGSRKRTGSGSASP